MQSEAPHHVQWLWIGLAVMFVDIGAAVLVSVVFLNGSTILSNLGAMWGIAGPLIGFSFLIFWLFAWAGCPPVVGIGGGDTGDMDRTMMMQFRY